MKKNSIILLFIITGFLTSQLFCIDPAIKADPQGFAARVQAKTEPGYKSTVRAPTRNPSWSTARPLDHPGIILYRWRRFNGNWSSWLIPGDGDGDSKFASRLQWCYFEDHTHEFIAQTAIMLPGIPVSPGTAAGTTTNLSSSKNNFDGITGLQIVEEDKEYVWKGFGNTPVTITPDTLIEYRFDFSDPHDTKPVSGSFDPFKTPDISAAISGKHKYTESGQKYPIFLTIIYSERSTTTAGAFKDEMKTRIAGPFNVVVIDHLPEYVGNALIMINGPGNSTGKNLPDKKRTEYVYEDSQETFSLIGLFKFWAELPAGVDTGVSPDRFGGVDPLSVKYKIDFGDGTPETNWQQWQEVQQIRPKTINDPIKQDEFETNPFKHLWAEPGEYRFKVTLSYQEIEYTDIVFNSSTYSYTKKRSPERFGIYSHTIIVFDRTPPRINSSEIKEYTGTTGDELEFSFYIEDNNMHKPLSSACCYIEDHKNEGKYLRHDLTISDKTPGQQPGYGYDLTAKIKMPDDYAHKESTEKKALRYYIELIDGAGNKNIGETAIVENLSPDYGKTSSIIFGNLVIKDNDPPSISVTVLYNNNKVFSRKFSECIQDNLNKGILEYGNLKSTNLLLSDEVDIHDITNNPAMFGNTIKDIFINNLTMQVQEDKRFHLLVEASDNVDKQKISKLIYEFDSGKKGEENSNKASLFLIFNDPGDHKLSISAEDRNNLDGTFATRKITIPFKVSDSFFKTKTLGSTKK